MRGNPDARLTHKKIETFIRFSENEVNSIQISQVKSMVNLKFICTTFFGKVNSKTTTVAYKCFYFQNLAQNHQIAAEFCYRSK